MARLPTECVSLGKLCVFFCVFFINTNDVFSLWIVYKHILAVQVCVLLCYVYPAMLHYKACAHTRREKWGDIAMIVFGFAFTTVQTVKLMIEPQTEGPPLGECPPKV
ncbi:hypothetical protein BDP27DRAFT_1360333 [Rhodocollybia butyracea]|uniref:Uncharacterized protein n=1 Tax=Rhodocollybia butyracea TaxID=206335 RepID=A0A9P5UBT6_9AGAR|nr:hypothetical protein BDP27DRAFT_1360333 [Rhodocollybia butyracea]